MKDELCFVMCDNCLPQKEYPIRYMWPAYRNTVNIFGQQGLLIFWKKKETVSNHSDKLIIWTVLENGTYEDAYVSCIF